MSREINASMQNNASTLNEVYQFFSVYLFRPRPQPGPHLHSMCTAQEFFLLCEDEPSGILPSAPQQIMASVSVSSRRAQLLEWFPFYVHRFIGDVRYRAMKDYQQAWYLNLIFASWVSERPGYLPDDGQLWRLANARTRQFFEKECEPVGSRGMAHIACQIFCRLFRVFLSDSGNTQPIVD